MADQPGGSGDDLQLVSVEETVLDIADEFNIRIVWDDDAKILTGVCAVVGGVVGGYAGGVAGAALGAGIGGATGLAVSGVRSLREVWPVARSQLSQLVFVVLNRLRELHASDLARLLRAGASARVQLALAIVDVLVDTLNQPVLSDISSHHYQHHHRH